MKLSICIPVYGKVNFTLSCLQDLLHLPEDHEILVFDNNSPDDTKQKLENYPRIKYIHSEENLGFAAACNHLYRYSSAPNVMFLNNDIRVKDLHQSWTSEIIEKCSSGLVGPTMGMLNSSFEFVKEADEYLDSPYSYMSGWCLASSKDNWEKLRIKRPAVKTDITPQIFSEDFFCYFEDTDLSFRARKLSIPFHVVKIPVVHFGKVSSKQINTYQLYTKGKKIFHEKWSKK